MSDWKNVQYKDGKMRTSESGGGGGGGLTQTVIYTGNDQPTYYQLTQPLTDFDAIAVYTISSSWYTSNIFLVSELMDKAGVDARFGTFSDAAYIYFKVIDASTLQRSDTNGWKIYKIIGLKFGSGGGGGASALNDLSDVNVSTPTDGQALKYDDTTSKWVNANSGGGGSITEESLWTASSQSTGDFTLNKSIDNFDFIAIWYGDWNERTKWRNYILYSVASLNANHSAGLKISVIGYSTRYNIIDISGTTLSIQTNTGQAILEVRGIKYS